MAFWIPLAMAAAGAAKTQFIDKPNADQQRKYEAKTAELSPWTGLQGKYVQDPSVLGGAMKGGMAGLALNQQIQSAQNMSNFNQNLPVQNQQGYFNGQFKPQSYTQLNNQNSNQDMWANLQQNLFQKG